MKQLKAYIGSALLLAFGLAGCQNDFDSLGLMEPQATIVPNTDIIDFKEKNWEDADNYYKQVGTKDNGENIIISGRVISSDYSGNIYKNLVIQDRTAALTLSINANSLYNDYRIGQEIVIDLTGMYVGKYSGLQQMGFPDDDETYGAQTTFMPLEFFKQHAQLNGLPDSEKIDTITTTIASLQTTPEGLRKWQSQLVRLNNVHFELGGEANFTDAQKENSNRTLLDANGNSIIVRNSGYANFYAEKLPEGSGDVVGILSYFGSSGWQLLLRGTSDCMNFGNPTVAPGGEDNPYTVDQAVEIIASGQENVRGWVTGYIVGAVAPEVDKVSGNEDIEWGAPTVLANTLVVAPAADIKEISKCLVISLPQDSKLREFGNLKDNVDNLGKQIWLLGTFGRYMEANGILDNSGTASEFKIEGLTIPGGAPGNNGDGSESSPYSVTQVLEGATGSGVWVSGYIVGWIDGKSIQDGANFNNSSTSATNVMIAATPAETDYTKCLPVQLPAGNLRTGINLMDNPANYGKLLSYKGNITAYFGVTGLKEGTDYKLEGEGSGDEPETPVEALTSLSEDFSNGIPSTWKNVGTYPFYGTSFNGVYYAAVTGFKGTPPFDQWLITPALNVADAENKILAFETQVNGYGSTMSTFKVYVLSSDDPATATKTELNAILAAAPASGYSGWTASGDIDLSAYGSEVYIGFNYVSPAADNYATWCVTNVKFNAEGNVTPDTPDNPDTPSTPGEGVTTNSADFDTLNGGSAVSQYSGPYSSSDGWMVNNVQLAVGGEKLGSTAMDFIPSGTMAVIINGKISAVGTITSPTIANGIGTLTFDYGNAYSEKNGVDIAINVKSGGSVVKTVDFVKSNADVAKATAYTATVDLNVSGDVVIEFVNNSPTKADGNKDRVAIWNVNWTNF